MMKTINDGIYFQNDGLLIIRMGEGLIGVSGGTAVKDDEVLKMISFRRLNEKSTPGELIHDDYDTKSDVMIVFNNDESIERFIKQLTVLQHKDKAP